MKINSVNQNSAAPASSCNKRKSITFSATPFEIAEKISKANICPGRAGFLQSIALAFEKIESKFLSKEGAPEQITYKLGQTNEVPEFFKNISTKNKFFPSFLTGKKADKKWKEIDTILNEEVFQCHPDSTCGCGKGKTKGEFAKELLRRIGVNEPNVITIKRNP